MNQLHYIEAFPKVYTPTQRYEDETGITGVSVVDRGAILMHSGTLVLQPYHYYYNGANWLPDDPTVMRGAAEHDFFTGLMQRGLLPYSYYDQVAIRMYDVCKADGADVLALAAIDKGLNSQAAKAYAHPNNYVAPKEMKSPDPDWEQADTEEHTDH